MRDEGRQENQLRPLRFKRGYLKYPEGSVLVECGDTLILCTASVEENVPPFLRGEGRGWITAEYALLPRSTDLRNPRGRVSGRNHEIQRLIGRSLRSVINLKEMGERTVWIDCDVLQADGGTRTASINGAFIALVDALLHLKKINRINVLPVSDYLAAVSVGLVDGRVLLDLNYREDAKASVDLNVVMTGRGNLVEIQGAAEGNPFNREQLASLITVAQEGINEIILKQKEILGEIW